MWTFAIFWIMTNPSISIRQQFGMSGDPTWATHRRPKSSAPVHFRKVIYNLSSYYGNTRDQLVKFKMTRANAEPAAVCFIFPDPWFRARRLGPHLDLFKWVSRHFGKTLVLKSGIKKQFQSILCHIRGNGSTRTAVWQDWRQSRGRHHEGVRNAKWCLPGLSDPRDMMSIPVTGSINPARYLILRAGLVTAWTLPLARACTWGLVSRLSDFGWISAEFTITSSKSQPRSDSPSLSSELEHRLPEARSLLTDKAKPLSLG